MQYSTRHLIIRVYEEKTNIIYSKFSNTPPSLFLRKWHLEYNFKTVEWKIIFYYSKDTKTNSKRFQVGRSLPFNNSKYIVNKRTTCSLHGVLWRFFSNTDYYLRGLIFFHWTRSSSDSVKNRVCWNVHDVGCDVFRGPSDAAASHPLSDTRDLVFTRRW